MYPLLARRSHLAVYLLLWLLMGVLLAALLARAGGPAVDRRLRRRRCRWRSRTRSSACRPGTSRAACRSPAPARSGSWRPRWRGGAVVGDVAGARLAAGSALSRRALAGAGGADVRRRSRRCCSGSACCCTCCRWPSATCSPSFEASQEAQRRGLQGQVLAREAELRSLRAQIDPHFLFNSLHSISALTTADPPGARRMCLLLGDFLRETPGARRRGSDHAVAGAGADRPLPRDRAGAVRRSAARGRVDAGNAGDCLVPPLLLQPLVENAVTHGIAHLLEGGTVRVTRRPRRRRGCGSSSRIRAIPTGRSARGAGVGLANVRRAAARAARRRRDARRRRERTTVWRVELTLPAVDGEPS